MGVAFSTHLEHGAPPPRPYTRIININLRCNICELLSFLLYFSIFFPPPLLHDLLSAPWAYARQHKSPQLPDVLLLCGEQQVVASQQVDHSFQKRSSLRNSFEATEELRKISCGTMKELMQLVEPISGLCYCHKIVFCLLNVRKHVTVVCLWNGPQLMSFLSLNTLGVTQTETATTCKTSGSDNAKFGMQRNSTVYCFPHTVLTFSQFSQLFKSKELKSLIKACWKSEPGSGKCVWQSQPAAP